jgi:hypothetical protein
MVGEERYVLSTQRINSGDKGDGQGGVGRPREVKTSKPRACFQAAGETHGCDCQQARDGHRGQRFVGGCRYLTVHEAIVAHGLLILLKSRDEHLVLGQEKNGEVVAVTLSFA